MNTVTLTADPEARITLPRSFANAKSIVEMMSETEILLRLAGPADDESVRFVEEEPIVLSDRDRDLFLEALDHPPAPNEALIKAMRRSRDG